MPRSHLRPLALVAAALAVTLGAAALWRATWGRSHASARQPNGGPLAPAPRALAADAVLPVVNGRAESCVACHRGIEGLDASHRPENVGCASCHGGNGLARTADVAHSGMRLVPGNLADAALSCGQAACHVSIIPRVERSIMTTMAGVIAVDREVFGVPASSRPAHVVALGHDAADTHLRQLCASCHLGQQKGEWGPVTDASRGGGCNACHLVYDTVAARQLAAFTATPARERVGIPLRHPSFSAAPTDAHCFGCHSRSSRIATNYEGWHERAASPTQAAARADTAHNATSLRTLSDGRTFARVRDDVHHARGMSCIDCHTAGEVMGSGQAVRYKRDQLRVRCEDCHSRALRAVSPARADEESVKLMALRQWRPTGGERLAVTATGDVLWNVVVDSAGRARVRHKRSGVWVASKPPAAACTRGTAHTRLTCAACHTAWAPRCATCHTGFNAAAQGYDHVAQRDVTGAWEERGGAYEAVPPTLGVRADGGRRDGVIDTFVPGMIATIDTGSTRTPIFVRRYARIAAHTVSREARSCTSCHNDPIALGLGRGTLRFTARGRAGAWSFIPAESLATDGLPADAWTGLARTRPAARDGSRPFSGDEQRRILRVGACLTCHDAGSVAMQRALDDFPAALAARSARCATP